MPPYCFNSSFLPLAGFFLLLFGKRSKLVSMITESGRVVAIEKDCLWVETIRRSTCGSCSAQKACGHGLMNQLTSGRQHLVRVLPGTFQASDFQLDNQVEIAIPERLLVGGALIVYLLPILALLAGGAIASQFWSGDGAALIGSILGFVSGFVLVFWHGRYSRDLPELQPQVVAHLGSLACAGNEARVVDISE